MRRPKRRWLVNSRAAQLDAELAQIIEQKHPFSPGEAMWFSGVEAGVVAFEWKHGRIGPSLDCRVRKRRHAMNLNDLLYLAGLAELGPVRGPVWRAELRKGFPRAVRRGAELYSFGPYPVTMAPIRRRLIRRLRRLVAMRRYVTGQKSCLFVAGTTLSPFDIAKRLADGDTENLRLEHPEVTDRHLRRARCYAGLHLGSPSGRNCRAPMKVLATAQAVIRASDRGASDALAIDLFASSDMMLANIQAWRAKHAGR